MAGFRSGLVTLTFDDGWRCAYDNAAPRLDRAGLRATYYVITGCLDDEQFPRYMNLDQIRDLANRGHEIGCHTASHKRLTTETKHIIEEEIVLSRGYLAQRVGRVDTFCYPYGDYDVRVVEVVKRAGFLGARTLRDGFNTDDLDPFFLKSKSVNCETTHSEVATWIDTARRRNVWLVLTFHQIDHEGREFSCTPETLQGIIDHLGATGVSVVTVRDAIAKLGALA